jgi:hypothetical protein
VKEGEGNERMRGDDDQQDGIFSYISPEKRVPADHPLRPIRKMVDETLKEMSPKFADVRSADRARTFPTPREIHQNWKYPRNSKNRFFEFKQQRPSGKFTLGHPSKFRNTKGADTR